MKILLDTCEFLWLISGDPKLSEPVTDAIRDARNEVFLSTVSFWESASSTVWANFRCHKPAQFIPFQREQHRILSLALDESSVAQLSELPGLHRDPFDRMLICQAKAHGLLLASSDPLVKQYPVTCL